MDLYIVGAVAMLVAWAAAVVTTDAPGWVHLLLTFGMFLLIWRIVVRGTPSGPRTTSASNSTNNSTPGSPESNKRK